MSLENKILDITFAADEDLTADQFKIVVLDATSGQVRRPNAATDIPLGVLQNAPNLGEAAVVRPIGCGGISLVQASAALGIGTIVGMTYVSAADGGKAQAAVTTQYPVGVLLSASANADELCSMLMTPLTVKA